MKLMIASDIHGSALYCEKMVEAFHREGAERLLLLGDILYHGPRNDLPEGYAPKTVIGQLSPLRDRVLCVRGNCDTEVDQMVLPFPILADYAVLWAEGRTFYATHGHVFNAETPPPLQKGDILLMGHTHVPQWETREDFYCANPGSVSIPKAGSERGYMVLEDGALSWRTLAGVEYARQQL